MVSKLARSQIDKWWSEGLRPTVDDIVKVNDLGLKVERGSDVFDFGASPRAAFLGDNILWEPTVGKRIWMDAAMEVVDASTVESRIYVMAYALGTPEEELVSLTKKSKLVDAVVKFRDEVLMDKTDTQILAALDWAINGNPPEDEDDEVRDPPEESEGMNKSVAKQILLEAIGEGMSDGVARHALLADLQRMVLVASMRKGVDILKNEHAQSAGRFYVACGKIHERLVKEAEEERNKKEGKQDGES